MVALALSIAFALAQDGSDDLRPDEPAAPRETPRLLHVPEPSRRIVDRPEPGPSPAGFALWTGVVLALMAGAFALLRRWTRGTRFAAAGGAIDVLARKSVGPKQDLYLVGVGPKVFLLGATRERLSTLGEFSHADEVALLRADLPGRREDSARSTFRDSLREGLREGEAAPPAEVAYASIADEIAEIRKTVKAWKA